MKIERIETFAVQAPPSDARPYWGSRAWGNTEADAAPEISAEYPTPIRRRYLYSQTIDTVIVRLTTDSGLVGYGEAKAPVAPQATKAIIDLLLADIVRGADPREVTVLWERMYAGMRVRGHRAGFYLEAMSGIDIALWDLAAQAAGVSIASLLGGVFRNPIRVYASGLPALDRHAGSEALEALVHEAARIRAEGYTGLKMALGKGIEGDLRSVRAVRDRLGDDFLIYTDAAGVYDRAQALKLGRELEALRVAWLEMPIPPEDVDGYGQLADALTLPIALDSLSSRYEVAELIRRRGLDVVQPDVCRAGGITECRRIAELADAFGLAFAPHVSIGSAVHVAATLHLAAAMPNTMTSEYWIGDNPIGNAWLKQPIELVDGYVALPVGSGLGIALTPEALEPWAGSR
jgi:L-alanine-DL-glutamate epimerase-like enolase superfamily enzyme